MPLSRPARKEIESAELRISPIVLFEIQLLGEIGRLNAPPAEWLTILRRDFEVSLCPLPFYEGVGASYSEQWTRDPFDRLIVAQAKLGGGKLITRDRAIRENFDNEVW